jgi:uncharacterized protein (DUF2147 family)
MITKRIGSVVVLVAMIGLVGIALAADKAKSPVGVWETIDDKTNKPKSHVQIFERNGKLYGKIVKLLLKPPDTKCTECTGKRKDQPVLGMEIMWDMVQDDDEWNDGEILDPENGKTYDCKIWREGNKLMVRGYIAFFFRTQTWNLISEGGTGN